MSLYQLIVDALNDPQHERILQELSDDGSEVLLKNEVKYRLEWSNMCQLDVEVPILNLKQHL